MVFFALKPIYYMISKTVRGKNPEVTWQDIKKFMQGDFVKQVQDMKADDIPDKVKDFVLKEYLNTEKWDIDKITKASTPAGYLAAYAKSQLAYADILTKVDPMKREISELQEEGNKLEKQSEELVQTIDELEKKTKLLEQQYETLIGEKQEIVTDMTKVEDKVHRSRNLLNNLASEKERWEDTSKNFKVQLASMLGDVFLSSSFLAYIGFFDHYYRRLLNTVWKSTLKASRVKYREELALIEFLSMPNERLSWKSHKLPSD